MKPLTRVGQLARPNRGRKRFLLLAILVCVALWTAGLVDFANRIPDRVAEPGLATEAIVVLTGGSKRVEAGLQLLAAEKADRVFVSGAHRDVAPSELLALVPSLPAHLVCCVDVGHGAEDTAGNAAETADWMRSKEYRSLRLVTSSYHMPRSLFEFQVSLPDVAVIPHPVFPESVDAARWWRRPGTAVLIVQEYSKYLLARARHALDQLFSGT